MSDFQPQRINLGSRGVAKILGEAEAKILHILWKHGSLSVRDVVTKLRAQNHPLSFNAAMTILNRLVAKGILHKELKQSAEGRDVFLYAAREGRAPFLKRMCHDVLSKVFRDDALFSAAGFAEAIDHLPRKEREAITKLLRKQQT